MIITLIKHYVFEYAIEKVFDKIKSNFTEATRLRRGAIKIWRVYPLKESYLKMERIDRMVNSLKR